MSKNGLELLAPAGNLQTLKKVVDAGCDAVYFGGSMFGARAYADNFCFNDAIEGIKYAHLFNAKAFLTVNTLIKNIEYSKLYLYIKEYRDAGIDAVLVQDFSVLKFIRDNFPDLDVHASTQMSVTSQFGVSFLQDQGVKRIVLARELSLGEISDIYENTGAELEAFVHGAICVCYSGQCLLSSMLGGRSGNRGRCAQPCRLPYELYDGNKMISGNSRYLLSPKDMCLIKNIPELSDAGVYSLKIEGRMKSEEYASGVVSVYRKYIDRYLSTDRPYEVSNEDMDILMGLGNRSGFTDIYIKNYNGPKLMSMDDSSLHTEQTEHTDKINIGTRKLEISMKVIIKKNTDFSIMLTSIKDNHDFSYNDKLSLLDISDICIWGDYPETAQNRPLNRDDVNKQLGKTGNTIFEVDNIDIEMDTDIFMPMGKINAYRREFISKLEEKIIDLFNSDKKELIKSTYTEEEVSDSYAIEQNFGKEYNRLSCDEINTYIFVTCIEQFNVVIKYADEKTGIIFDHSFLDIDHSKLNHYIELVHAAGSYAILKFPQVLRDRACFYLEKNKGIIKDFDMYVASSYDTLGFLDKIRIPRNIVILEHRLYTYNDNSVDAFRSLGYKINMTPFELNKAELGHRDNTGSVISVYGRTELMIKADCTRKNIKGCDKCQSILKLKDRKGKFFSVRNDCTVCMNTIYNSIPLNLIDKVEDIKKMGFSGVRLDFTIESGKETLEIMNIFKSVKNNKFTYESGFSNDFTKGHYNRGVE
ncbi:MAG: U32 family peptidase [Lachnospiraceae bacterium]|nr:U32 family peptidase [Lachnospiraceae bacterium]